MENKFLSISHWDDYVNDLSFANKVAPKERKKYNQQIAFQQLARNPIFTSRLSPLARSVKKIIVAKR